MMIQKSQKFISDTDIVCFSFTDWRTELVSNRRHILSRFAKRNRVFLFERQVLPFKKEISRIFRIFRVYKIDGIYLITPGFYLPFGRLNLIIYQIYYRILRRRYNLKNPVFWFYNFRLASLIDTFKPKLSCYHCTELYSQNWRDKGQKKPKKVANIKIQEERMSRKVDLIFAVSAYLSKYLKKYNRHTFPALNAVDYSLYRSSQNDSRFRFGQEPVLGYIGNIADGKTNFRLLYDISEAFPGYRLVLAGPVNSRNPYLARLKSQKNVLFLGKREVEELPEIMRDFTICLMPYIFEKWMLKAGQPLKFMEYFASGKPVVSVPFESLIEYKRLVYTADSSREFIKKIKAAVREKDYRLREDRIKIAKENTWDKRFDFINRMMLKSLKSKRHNEQMANN